MSAAAFTLAAVFRRRLLSFNARRLLLQKVFSLAGIEKLTEDKTVIIIAHRLKTVRNAQQIVVITNGGIVQRGTHQELMEQPGIYADFVNVREKAVNWKLSGDKPRL